MNLDFREATINDAPQLLELEQCVIEAERRYNSSLKPEFAIYYDIENLISCDSSHLLVLEVENEIIATGYVQIRGSKRSLKHEQHAYLGFMYVLPAYRGQGINSQLIKQLIEWSKLKEVYDFYLDVYSENHSAVKAYEKIGFKPSLMEMKLSIK